MKLKSINFFTGVIKYTKFNKRKFSAFLFSVIITVSICFNYYYQKKVVI